MAPPSGSGFFADRYGVTADAAVPPRSRCRSALATATIVTQFRGTLQQAARGRCSLRSPRLRQNLGRDHRRDHRERRGNDRRVRANRPRRWLRADLWSRRCRRCTPLAPRPKRDWILAFTFLNTVEEIRVFRTIGLVDLVL